MSRQRQSGYWDRYWSRQVTRRRAIQGGAAGSIGLAGFALVGCGGDDDDGTGNGGESSPTPAATQGVRPTSTPGSNPTADPNEVDTTSIQQVHHSTILATINPWKDILTGALWGWFLYDHLFVTPLDTGEPELFLAESLEQPDEVTLNFTLKESYFHDIAPVSGRRILASDVKNSFEQSRQAPGISQTSYWTDVFGSADAPDDSTVIVHHNTVDAWAFSAENLASPINSSILPEEHTLDPDQMDTTIIGSGRFKLISHENGANFVTERFENWRNEGRPFLAGQQWKLIQDQALALAAFADRQVDSVGLANVRERDQLRDQLGEDLVAFDEDLSRSIYTIQGRADGMWADPRVIQAVSMAINRAELIDLMLFGSGVPSAPVSPAFASAQLTDEELAETWFKFDPTEARALLAATDFDADAEIELKYHTLGANNQIFAELMAAQLGENLGLNIQVIGEDLNTWLQQSFYTGAYTGFMTYPSVAFETPADYMFFTKEIGGRPNWAGFINDELDALFKQQKQTLDTEERLEMVKQLQRRGWELGAPYIPTVVGISYSAAWNYLKNRITGRGTFSLYNDELWVDGDER